MYKSLLIVASSLTCAGGSMIAASAIENFKQAQKVKDLNFDTAYRSGKIGFAHLKPQSIHANKYSEQANAWSGPLFSVYWGRNYNEPFNAQQIMKDSPISNFTLAFLNPLSNEDETQNLGAGYIDSFQEIHALGGNVTVSFGGWTPNESSFFNIDPSGAVMYEHLRELALGYNVNSFDFDLESVHTLTGNDVIACGMALHKLAGLLHSMHRQLHVRFTMTPSSYFTHYLDVLKGIVKYYGTNFIFNDMQWTQYFTPHNQSPSNDDAIAGVKADAKALRDNIPAFAKMSMQETYAHLGVTSALEPANQAGSQQLGKLSYDDFKKLIPWAITNHLGFIGLWNVGLDHKINSPLDPTQASQDSVTDFYFSKLIENQFADLATWNQTYSQLPQAVTGLRLYAKSQQYISLKWNPVANAKYYILEDAQGHVISQVQRSFAAISFREYPQLKVVGNHTFRVIAVNPKGKSPASKPLTVSIASTLIDGQIEYYDANINYYNVTWKGHPTPTSIVKYIYFQGNIYEDVNTTSKGIAMNHSPATDKTDWKLLGKATNPRFGLTANRISDLQNFEWDKNINDLYPLKYVQFNQGVNTLPLIPKFNNNI